MMMTDREHAAALRHGFPVLTPGHDEAAWRTALIAHVELHHDWAAAHELRLDKDQAAWTPSEARSFLDRVEAFFDRPRPPATPFVATVLEERRLYPATYETLSRLADHGLDYLAERRQRHPTEPLPIFVNALAGTGALYTSVVTPEQRVPLLQRLAATIPLYGFFVTHDAYIHRFEGTPLRAHRVDALLAHLRTRERATLCTRPYHAADDVVRWLPPEEIALADAQRVRDPYAAVVAQLV